MGHQTNIFNLFYFPSYPSPDSSSSWPFFHRRLGCSATQVGLLTSYTSDSILVSAQGFIMRRLEPAQPHSTSKNNRIQ